MPEIELRAVIQCVVEGDLGDRRFDQHLQRDDVELAQHSLDDRVFARRGVDQERVVAPVGDDPDAVFAFGSAGFGLRRQRLGGGIGALARRRGGRGRPGRRAGALRRRRRAGLTARRRTRPAGSPAEAAGHSERLGPGSGGTRRCRRRADTPRGKGSLQQGFEIGALTVLHVIDMPSPRGRVLELVCEPEKSSCRIDVAGL